MILLPASRPSAGRVIFDQLMQSAAKRAPDSPALIDAPNRPLFTEGPPRRLTWAQVDAATSAVSARLIELGLPVDSVVAIQGPNSVDMIIAILGCLRASLVPAVLPLGWRRAEAMAAVERSGAKAIFAANRAGRFSPSEMLSHVAADTFAIRFVCAFGADPPDGVISFEDCIADPRGGGIQRGPRLGNPAEHLAITTFDAGASGTFPVARSQNEWLAAGLTALSRIGLGRGDVLLSTLSPMTFAGLATGLVPWLMAGATLVLHQAFDADVASAQIERNGVTRLVLPWPVLEAAAQAGLFHEPSLKTLAGIVRRADVAPASAPAGPASVVALGVFGELGLMPLTAGDGGAWRLPLGPVVEAAALEGATEGIETGLTPDGTLALRGAMVPRAPLPGPERGAAYPIDAEGWVTTGFPARVDGRSLSVDGPRRDVVSVGGQSLPLASIDAAYAGAAGARSVSAVAAPDPLLGQRLALEAFAEPGAAVSAVALAMHGEEQGLSPLALTADATIGDRRLATRLAGAA